MSQISPSLLEPGRTVLISGGAGFIGSHLAEALLARGIKVIVVDDLSSGRVTNLPIGHRLLRFTEARLGSPAGDSIFAAALAEADLLYHLASPIGVLQAHAERYSMVHEMLATGLSVSDHCRRLRKPLVAISSSEIYGPGEDRPLREDDPCGFDLASRWGYATGKFALEQLVAGLVAEHGIPGWIVRPFNIGGPRQRPETGLCIAAFAARIRQNKPLVIHGDGRQRRAFLHVADAVKALLLIPQAADLIGRPVNLGSDQAVAIRDLAERMITLLNHSKGCEFHPYEEVFGNGFAPAGTRVPDISRLRNATGWQAEKPLDDVLRDCFDHLAVPVP
ncbi:NAD-dependent epimerase/dehydratase family protein [Ferrovibrio terrae]|uniref:NAD-dependent epimerase/dehydratase family protein n=1 Tax=Ferrovibrio terrae TaxID=2594003 RepID=UPI0031380A7C